MSAQVAPLRHASKAGAPLARAGFSRYFWRKVSVAPTRMFTPSPSSLASSVASACACALRQSCHAAAIGTSARTTSRATHVA